MTAITHNARMKHVAPGGHRMQGIVERFNLPAERLYGAQYTEGLEGIDRLTKCTHRLINWSWIRHDQYAITNAEMK